MLIPLPDFHISPFMLTKQTSFADGWALKLLLGTVKQVVDLLSLALEFQRSFSPSEADVRHIFFMSQSSMNRMLTPLPFNSR